MLSQRTTWQPQADLKMPGEETFPKQYGIGLQDSGGGLQPSSKEILRAGPFEDLPPGRYAILVFFWPKPYSVVRTSSQAGDLSGHDVNVTPGAALELTASLAVGQSALREPCRRRTNRLPA